MNDVQLEVLKWFNLTISHISTLYHLNTPIDINILTTAQIKCIYNTHASTVIVKDNKHYRIDLYPDGKIFIHRETNLINVFTLLNEFIKQFNIKCDTLDINNLSIDSIRCEGKPLYDIYINWILYDSQIKFINNNRIFYYLDKSNAYIGRNGIVLNSGSYNNVICMCNHIYTSFPVVLTILNCMDNSMFSTYSK